MTASGNTPRKTLDFCEQLQNPAKSKIKERHMKSKNEVAERPTDMGKNKIATRKSSAKTESKSSRLLANPDVKRWYDNIARGSVLTAENSLRCVGKFCEIHQISPIELAHLGMRDLRAATDLLEDHVTMMESREYSSGYITLTVQIIKSWLRHFDVEIRRRIKVAPNRNQRTIQKERVPNAQEMSEIYSRAGLRESVIISLMGKSGLRPEVIGNHDGTDGLCMRDLPDIVIHQGTVKCIRMPCMVNVRPSLSKARHRYFTFMTASAARQVVAYLNDRLAHGEPLHGDSPVVAPDHVHKTDRGRNNGKAFLITPQVSYLVRRTFRPRFTWRPYVLRAYFDTQLLIAESRGRMAHDFRVFFMGHRGSMEARYTTNKGVLPDVLVSEMRDAFGRSEEHLDQTEPDPVLEQRQEALGMVGDATPEQLGRVLEALRMPAICAQAARG